MRFLETCRRAFSRQEKEAEVNDGKGKFRAFFSKVSGSIMLPISVLSIAGIFLGVGSAIGSNSGGNITADEFGAFLRAVGAPVFSSIPLLFAIAIIIAFTEDIGVAVFAGVVAYIVFNSMQQPFISVSNAAAARYELDANNQPVLVSEAVDYNSARILINFNDPAIERIMYNIVGTNIGFTSVNASVFTGFVIGFLVVWVYKKFHLVELPVAIAFFGGKRFVALVSIVLMIPLAFLFMLTWPWIGTGFAYFGQYSGKVYGLDAFVATFIERTLIPFGFGAVFNAPLHFTAAGGSAAPLINDWLQSGNTFVAATDLSMNADLMRANGDQTIWIAANALPFNEVQYMSAGDPAIKSLPVFEFFQKELGLHLGRFMQGRFGFFQTGLPFAALAMVMAAPKSKRRLAAGIVIPAVIPGFLSGVTEPIEFTFVFLSPALYWGFHCFMAGLDGLLMVLAGVHIGTASSAGFIELVIYGIVPYQKGTNFWWAMVIAAGNAPLYYFFFYYWIKKFDVPTPGRGSTGLITKAIYNARKSMGATKEGDAASEETKKVLAAFGGWKNIKSAENCASRLRYEVYDGKLVDEAALKAIGAYGVVRVTPKSFQVVFGPRATSINAAIKNYGPKSLEAEAKNEKPKTERPETEKPKSESGKAKTGKAKTVTSKK